MEANTDPRRYRLCQLGVALDIILTVALVADLGVTWMCSTPGRSAPAAVPAPAAPVAP